jgi:hypothetical protein
MTACAADEATAIPDEERPSVGYILLTEGPDYLTVLFSPTPGPAWFHAASDATTCTCTQPGIALPVNVPSAGTITVQAPHCGATLATLLPKLSKPEGFSYTGPDITVRTPGEAFSVTAPGAPGGIAAFAGTLEIPAPFAGVMPRLGPTTQPLVVSRSKDLVVTWTPEGKTGETVDLFLVAQAPGVSGDLDCRCSTSDSAGKLTVPAATLSMFARTSGTLNEGTVSLRRYVVHTYPTGKSSVQLVGEIERSGSVSFE